MTALKVSILIPSYNHAALIERTIRSVWDQNYPNIEIVIIDDGSTDDSYEVVCKLLEFSPISMKVIKQKNTGICGTLNRALALSTGEIIGFIASDDIMLPNRLNQEVLWFQSRPSLKVLYSSGQFLSNGRQFGDVHKLIKPFLKRGIVAMRDHLLSTAPGFYLQAMLIRREFLLTLGAFDEKTGSDDWSLNIRIFKALTEENEYLFLDRFSFLYRHHGGQAHRREMTFMIPMARKVVRRYFSIENRSKIICKNYGRRAVKLCFQMKIRRGWRYLKMAVFIGFADGVPLKCLTEFVCELPVYVYHRLKRPLNISQFLSRANFEKIKSVSTLLKLIK